MPLAPFAPCFPLQAVLVDMHRLWPLLAVVLAGAAFDTWHSGGLDASSTEALLAAAGPALLKWGVAVGGLLAAVLAATRGLVGGRVFTGAAGRGNCRGAEQAGFCNWEWHAGSARTGRARACAACVLLSLTCLVATQCHPTAPPQAQSGLQRTCGPATPLPPCFLASCTAPPSCWRCQLTAWSRRQ